MTSAQSTADAFTLRGTLTLIAAIAMGFALQISDGNLHPDAFNTTFGVLVVTCLAVLWPDRELPHRASAVTLAGLVTALGVFFFLHFRTAPGIYLLPTTSYAAHHVFAGIAAAASGALIMRPRSPLLLGLLLLSAFGLGVWLLRASPAPEIDVWVWHGTAYEALVTGTNPYAINMPNIYGHTGFFAPGLADETRVFVGYPYPPVTMLLGLTGQLFAGDYRYWNLVAQLGAATLIARTSPGRTATLAAIVFLFQPRGLFVLEQGWTEATSSLGIAACVWCAVRWPRALPWVFGVMVGIKQYFVFAVPLLPLLLGTTDPRVLARFLLKAAIIPVVITVPFVLWDAAAFFSSVVAFQAKQPFRSESLSVMAWLVRKGGPMLPLNLNFGLAAGATGLALWRSKRSPAAFSAAFALALIFFFFFAKQAFTNYYYLIVACLCAGAGASAASLTAKGAEPREGT